MTNASNYSDTYTGITKGDPLSAATMTAALNTKEKVTNKQVSSTDDTVDALTANSSDSYYPSAKLAGKNLDALRNGKQDKLAADIAKNIVAYSGTAGTLGTLTRITTIDTATNASDDSIPTEKAVATALSGKADATTVNGKQDKLTDAQLALLDSLNTLSFFPKGTILAVTRAFWDERDNFFKTVWKLCDGSNNEAPNFTGKFLRGGKETSYGDTGGTNDQKIELKIEHLPSHTHIQKSHFHSLNSHADASADRAAGFGSSECKNGVTGAAMANQTMKWYEKDYADHALVSSETVVNENTGSDTPYKIELPEYYTVIYIMKVV